MPVQPGRELRVGYLPSGEVRVADVADLALGDEVVEGRERLLDGGETVRLVQLVEVDPVGLKPSEGGLDGEPDVAARGEHSPVGPVSPRHVHAELAREHYPVALALERIAHEGFAQAGCLAVDVGGVEERHAGVDRGVDDGVGALLRLRHGLRAAEVVAAEADRGDPEPRAAEVAVLDGAGVRRCHGSTLATPAQRCVDRRLHGCRGAAARCRGAGVASDHDRQQPTRLAPPRRESHRPA